MAHYANLTGVAQWAVGTSPVSTRNTIQTPETHFEFRASDLSNHPTTYLGRGNLE